MNGFDRFNRPKGDTVRSHSPKDDLACPVLLMQRKTRKNSLRKKTKLEHTSFLFIAFSLLLLLPLTRLGFFLNGHPLDSLAPWFSRMVMRGRRPECSELKM